MIGYKLHNRQAALDPHFFAGLELGKANGTRDQNRKTPHK
jgi:hypothetical protein